MSSYGNIPNPNDVQVDRGYGAASAQDFAQGPPTASSPISQSVQQSNAFADFDQAKRESSFLSDASPTLDRSASAASTAPVGTPSRNNTLRKRSSVKRTVSLKRSSSKRSLKAGSIKGLGGVDDPKSFNNAFYTPIPTHGTPTEVLAERFQAWRQFLKSLITYFREIQATYDTRAKAIHKVQNTLSNISHPAVFTTKHGLAEASRILEDYHKRSISEANKSREIENDVISALTGLRNDLGQKIKEIKSLSGDFKNSVERETEVTRREVEKLQDALAHAGIDDATHSGKHDPYVLRLGVERAIEKQIDEENYLHRAYLNLESSGRELESIVVGEVQKAYNALAGILRREADDAYTCVENLRTGPIAMPKDQEWMEFVVNDRHFVDPTLPLRRVEDITYPGKFDTAATEIRAGMLERKSKYLKSYSPGWYVLSPTHLHEFKSADKIHSQPPVMSLPLSEQKLGSKSEPGSSSHKFMLKGKQGGGMHKGHNWVFRAESHDTMLAWFDDIRALTEKTGAERKAFVRSHARSVSGTSDKGTVSTEGDLEDDEADAMPYSGPNSLAAKSPVEEKPQRPQPGGRFPSDLRIPILADATGARVSEESDEPQEDAAVRPLIASTPVAYARSGQDPYRLDGVASHTRATSEGQSFDSPPAQHDPIAQTPAPQTQTQTPTPPVPAAPISIVQTSAAPLPVQQESSSAYSAASPIPPQVATPDPITSSSISRATDARPVSDSGDRLAAAAAGVAGLGAGAVAAEAYHHEQNEPFPDYDQRDEGIQTDPIIDTSVATSLPTKTDGEVLLSATQSANSVSPVSGMTDDTEATEVTDLATPLASESNRRELGGLEKEGARETGRAIPVIRHRSDMSVSGLHIPGAFGRE